MNLPNSLTIFRILVSPAIPFLLIFGDDKMRLMAIFLFILAAFTDWFDGWYARRFDQVTNLGKILDPIADKVMVLSLFSAFAFLGMYSIWFVAVILIRELLVTIIRLNFLKKGKVIAAEMSGKIKTALQMGSLFFFGVYFYFLEYKTDLLNDTANLILGTVMYTLLWLCVFATIYSGYEFFFNNFKPKSKKKPTKKSKKK